MKNRCSELNAVYCCSDFFSEVCGVSIVSLFENNKHINTINIYIIDDNISVTNKERLLMIAESYCRCLIFIPLPDPAKFFKDKRLSKDVMGHTYGRLILGSIIPENVSRILSLDCDTMVLNKIDDLWTIDLSNNPIAGVDDCMGRVALVKTQHMKEDAVHCNAGMLMLDLDIWRRENWTKQFYEYISDLLTKGYSLGGYEEEVINMVLGKRMLVLHPRFNLMTIEQVLEYEEMLFFREPINYYSKKEIIEAKLNAVITHTTNFFYIRKRVFETNSDHPMRANYEKYRKMTPWKDELEIKYDFKVKHFILKEIWHCMPRKLALRLGRFVRNHIRPLLNKKRDDE